MNETEVVFSTEDQEVKACPSMDQQLKFLIWNWHSKETSTETPPNREWWEFWKVDEKRKRSIRVIGRYLLEALDDFVRIAMVQTHNTIELKATILASISALYDTVITGAKLPWWVKPFGKSVKTLVIDVLASLLIDYMIRRYDSGTFS